MRIAPLAIVLATAVAALSCARAPNPAPAASPSAPVAPWSAAPLALTAVSDVYVQEWSRAANRTSCALLAPASLGAGGGARPRGASFSGGWAVAYDRGDVRSAFGVAGTGTAASAESYNAWPHRLAWRDGSTAGYGPEGGGVTNNQLAYLRVAGQGCLYNVWSRLGREHLEHLLSQLRFVR